jgi:hypothetical protein
MELLFNIDLAGISSGSSQARIQPICWRLRPCLAMSMVAPVRCGLAMSPSAAAALPLILLQLLLIGDGAHRRADQQRRVKLGRMGARQVGRKLAVQGRQ